MDDSDDLFGGLPAALKAENVPATTGASSTAITNTTKNHQRKNVVDGMERSSKKRKEGASLVSSLGTAGTAMAFVPQAIRKKKKITQRKPQPQQQQVLKKQSFVGEKSIEVTQAQNSTISDCNDTKKASDNQETKLAASEITWEKSTNKWNNESQVQSNDNDKTHDNNEPYLENEPESLRLLHASVIHPYDPHVPNDYLAHRERKKTEQVRKDLQRSALQRLDQQEKLRKKIEEERKKIMASGDLDQIVESGAMSGGRAGRGRGMGRGRGVSNLPAWLLKKQQEQQAEANASSSYSKPADGQFDDFAS
mmetsp:Transcript_20156/g.43785  ORF Transcript_20156/g.43785 Transcript_20156/m.43785 type:complete len:308 (-) Transcript_20156:92-1015(-)|eukprot:CAMPEP_0172327634 /NCGR_PEP_ID=MMETSP1058-20130122/59935_1 /TAXON_ID=83371 /ORGANISM="Detonula confervacea, Strain CCMP 353" /LENGTH=307 /DNA_ID=CAMNT_0013044715 /DNA_START=168 /DNA_END=1091 /DNA_ORIENTATION=-